MRLSHVRRCDLYHALGVRPTASQHELREAYLRRAKQYHPDVAWPDLLLQRSVFCITEPSLSIQCSQKDP